jgi:UDP-N-acetyl-D-mannosaminuronic acid dehydrogenase
MSHYKINQILLIGLGRIGLPQSLTLANNGIKVYGFDCNPLTIEALNRGETPFYEPFMDESLKKNLGKSFFPFSSWESLNDYLPNMDAILFTIGTQAPSQLDAIDNVPFDLTEYFLLLDQLFSNKKAALKKGIKLIIRTTLPLGSTDKLKSYLEKKYSLKEGEDFYLAFVPERITEGQVMEELKTVPKIIGVYSDEAFEPISQLFQNIGGKIIRVRNPLTAEFCKLTDNSFRNTIFSYANEIAMHASELNIDVEEVINVVNNHYERNNIPQPGFVSGYCLSKDPYIFELDFLKNKPTRDFHSLWYYGRKTNDYLIDFVVAKVLKNLKNKEASTVALLGLSFKEDVDDFRMSHSFKIIEKLIAANVAHLKVYDPYLEQNKYTSIPKEYAPYIVGKANILDSAILTDVDAMILCIRHQQLLEFNKVNKLTELFSKTHQPCYLFDGWDSWEEAVKIKHIHYEGIGFKKHYTLRP